MKARSIDYQNSELVSSGNSLVTHQSGFWNWLEQISRSLVNALTKAHELKIKQITDRAGNVAWTAYDPAQQQTLWFHSETEVRIWLDGRFS